MKIDSIEQSKMVIYLNFFNKENEPFKNIDDLEENFKNLFLRLKTYYNMDIRGYYEIQVYYDKMYGLILEIEKEDIEYIDYFNNQIDMKIISNNTTFLYQIPDYFMINKDIYNKINIYKYKNNLYLEIKDDLKNKDFINILEHSKIIYKDTSEIRKKGNIIKI